MRFEEQSTLKRFILFYFGSTFVLLGIIFFLIYRVQLESQFDLTKAQMKNFSFALSSKIINAHMHGEHLDFDSLKERRYRFALYDKNGTKLYGDPIDRSRVIIEDRSPLGHLGVWKIVVEDDSFAAHKHALQRKLLLGFLLSYLVIMLVGYYLIRLFMKPIEEARERIDNFIKDTTHELNTPVTAIMLCANKEALNNPKNIERIYLSARRISELYKDLTYIFLEEGSKKKREVVLLKEEIEALMGYFELLAAKKRITITRSLDESTFMIDREDFKRLFSNLLSNAIKYNRVGGTIEITLKEGRLSVKDSGIGIPEAKLHKIFDKYYRATTQSGGFGMGLSIVEKICREYGIEVDVRSDESGTEFIVVFGE